MILTCQDSFVVAFYSIASLKMVRNCCHVHCFEMGSQHTDQFADLLSAILSEQD